MKVSKRISVLILALALAAQCSFAPLAAGTPCEITPLIIINGMNAVPLYSNYGTSDARQEFPPTGIQMLQALAKTLPPLMRMGLPWDWEQYSNFMMPTLRGMFEAIECNPDGSPKQEIGFLTFPDSYAQDNRFGTVETGLPFDLALAERIGKDHTWLHIFDWRLAQTDLAKDLNASSG